MEISNIQINNIAGGKLKNKTVLCESAHRDDEAPLYKIVVEGQRIGVTYIEIVSRPLCDRSSAALFFNIIKSLCETPLKDSKKKDR